MFKIKLHSVVDVITNSSTVIYTYHDGCVDPAKELINEMLKLSGVEDKTADDLFYFGVFCGSETYFDVLDYSDDNDIELPDDYVHIEGTWDSIERKELTKKREKWINDLFLSIMKGEIEKPDWMKQCEKPNDDWFSPDSLLLLVPKDEKYKEFGEKIVKLLSGVTADGGRDG